jgi:hypothetical protein
MSRNRAEPEKHQSAEERETVEADQLWNVMEFSARFPELTLELVSVLKTEEQPDNGKPAEEELQFPDLVTPDPRTVKMQKERQRRTKKISERQIASSGQSRSARWKKCVPVLLLAGAVLLFLAVR